MPIRLRMKIAEKGVKQHDSENSERKCRMKHSIRHYKPVLVQFKTRTNHPVNAANQHHQAGFEVTMQRNLVHTVQ